MKGFVNDLHITQFFKKSIVCCLNEINCEYTHSSGQPIQAFQWQMLIYKEPCAWQLKLHLRKLFKKTEL